MAIILSECYKEESYDAVRRVLIAFCNLTVRYNDATRVVSFLVLYGSVDIRKATLHFSKQTQFSFWKGLSWFTFF